MRRFRRAQSATRPSARLRSTTAAPCRWLGDRLLLEPLEARNLLTTVNWDGGGDGTSFTDPLNWDTNSMPGINDDAVINVVANPTVTLSANVTVKSVTSAEAFSITGGTLNVSANSTFNNSFNMTGGTLNASGAGVTVSASSTTTVANSSLNAAAGATISLPNLNSYSNSGGGRSLSASGAGSVLSLPNLTSLTTSGNHTVSLIAQTGGQVNLNALPTLSTAPISITASDAGSQVNIPLLTTFNGAAGFSNSSINLNSGGTFSHGNITSMDRVNINLDGAASTISFAALAALSNGQLSATGGATLSLPTVTSYSNANGTQPISANGAGSVVSLAGLTSLTTTGNNTIAIQSQAGGQVNFATLASITAAPVTVTATSAGSQVNMPLLTTFNGAAGFSNSSINLNSGGTFSHGNIPSMTRVNINLDGPASTISFTALASLANSQLSATSGATLSLPTVTSYSNANGTQFISANGAGSVVSLPGLTSLSTTGNNAIAIQSLAGGQVNFATLASTTTGPVQITATSAGSQVNMPALTTFNGNAGNSNSSINLNAGGTFSHGNITSMDRVNINLDGPASTISFTALASLANSQLSATSGATLSLPTVTSYSNANSTQFISANGAGSVVSLPGLTSLTTTGNNTIAIQALGTGQVNFASLASMTTSPVSITATSAGSQVNMPALTTFNGNAGNSNSSINLNAGGTFGHGNITSMDRVNINLDGAASTISFTALASLANSQLSSTAGATLSLPTVTSYANANGSQFIVANGTGSVVSLPNLTSLTTTGNNPIGVAAQAGGQVTFANLTSITASPIAITANNVGSQVNMPALVTFNGAAGFSNSSINLNSGGTFNHGNIASLDRVNINLDGAASTTSFTALTSFLNAQLTASGGAALSLPTVTNYSNANGSQFIQASGLGSSVTLAGLTALSTTGSNPIAVQAQTGGQINLPALTQITTAPINLTATGAGSQVNVPSLTTYTAANNSTITANTGGVVNTGNNPGTVIRNVTLSSDATFTIGSNQTYLSDGNNTLMNVPNLLVQGKFTPDRVTVIDLNGNLTVDGAGALNSITVTGTINLSGSLLGNTTNNTQSKSQGFITFDGAGTVGTPQRLEAMSADLGAVQSAFDNNFAIGTLSLANNTYARLVDLADNSAGAGNEAVYVKKLNVPAGTTLDLNGLNLYVRASTIAGTIVNGSITTVTQNAVVNRQLFYNNSTRYDVAGPAIMPFPDDNAIAYDKVALRPGAGPATFANVSSYTRGLNGVVIDITGAHGAITAADFIFRVGNNNTPSTWVAAPAPTTVTVRSGAGTGADRVEIIWADGAITKKWLEVIVLANANTGLPHSPPLPAGQADVFFFGNALADSSFGDSATQATVNTTDELAARNNPANLAANIPITNLFDYNRDGQVNTTDALAARNNPTNAGNVVRFINIANPPAGPESATSSEGADQSIASALAAPATVSPLATAGPLRWSPPYGVPTLRGGSLAKALEQFADSGPIAQVKQRAVADVAELLSLDDELLDVLAAWNRAS